MMENIESSEQSVTLHVNGVAIDADVIAKDADLELNNNQTVETAEKTVKIPEDNSMEKSVESVDEQEKKVEPCEENLTTMDNGKENSVITDDKPLEGDSKVETTATEAEEKFDSCSSSSSVAMDEQSTDSESSTTSENAKSAEKTEKSDGSVEETVSDTVTSASSETEGRVDGNSKVDAVAVADSVVEHTTDAEQHKDTHTEQTTDKNEQSTAVESPSKSPSKKKSSPKKRKNRSRSQKKPFDYSHLVNYTLKVTPRHRRYFLNIPRGQNVATPSDDCEIFCTNIPINVLEQELIPLFEKFGKIFELRLMMSMRNPKRNAGFAFVRYTTDQSAKAATEQLNNYEIVPGKLLAVRLSQPNLSLFVGNLSRNLTREQIHEKIGHKTQGLVKTFVKSSLYESTKNCGFCFLEYDCHASALSAKRLLNHGNVWGRQLFVDWAQRRKQFNSSELQESKTLFINYLPRETTQEQIIETLSPYGTIEKVTKIKDYAFVLFTEHQAAIDAMNGADKTKFGSEMVEITLAMPKTIKPRNRFPSFSYHHRTRHNRRNNSYNRHRTSFGSTSKFFMHKQPQNKAVTATNTTTNTDEATAGVAATQTMVPMMIITPPEPIIAS